MSAAERQLVETALGRLFRAFEEMEMAAKNLNRHAPVFHRQAAGIAKEIDQLRNAVDATFAGDLPRPTGICANCFVWYTAHDALQTDGGRRPCRNDTGRICPPENARK
jgi:hypothetical protein